LSSSIPRALAPSAFIVIVTPIHRFAARHAGVKQGHRVEVAPPAVNPPSSSGPRPVSSSVLHTVTGKSNSPVRKRSGRPRVSLHCFVTF
jgi:hypothetical protein